MKSTILTSINTVNLQFKDQVTELKGYGDFEFLRLFVSHCHKNKETFIKNGSIEVFTSRSMFSYKIFPKYIMRIDCNNGNKKFYKIS